MRYHRVRNAQPHMLQTYSLRASIIPAATHTAPKTAAPASANAHAGISSATRLPNQFTVIFNAAFFVLFCHSHFIPPARRALTPRTRVHILFVKK